MTIDPDNLIKALQKAQIMSEGPEEFADYMRENPEDRFPDVLSDTDPKQTIQFAYVLCKNRTDNVDDFIVNLRRLYYPRLRQDPRESLEHFADSIERGSEPSALVILWLARGIRGYLEGDKSLTLDKALGLKPRQGRPPIVENLEALAADDDAMAMVFAALDNDETESDALFKLAATKSPQGWQTLKSKYYRRKRWYLRERAARRWFEKS